MDKDRKEQLTNENTNEENIKIDSNDLKNIENVETSEKVKLSEEDINAKNTFINDNTKENEFKELLNEKPFKKRKYKAIISIFLILILAISCSAYYYVYDTVKRYENKIYPEIYIYDINLSNLSKNEAIDEINKTLIEKIANNTITLSYKDTPFELKYSDIDFTINPSEIATKAFGIGKDLNLFDKFKRIKIKPNKISLTADYEYSAEKLNTFIYNLSESINIPVTEASISIENGNISVINEIIGVTSDNEKISNNIIATLSAEPNKHDNIQVTTIEIAPTKTAEQLNKINGVIASFSGTYVDSGDGRVENMRLATSFVNNTLLMPGEEFSYNKAIGDTTPERGYKIANTYVQDQVVPDYGGGVCQISTYLYRAAMRANLKPSLRYNHNMMVGYSKPSLDATVFEGDIDYRFINTYDFPVVIKGYMSGGYITFDIYGNKEGMNGRTYELVNEILEKIPYETIVTFDATKPIGYEKVTLNGEYGYKSNGYLLTYENGVQINSEYISTDSYLPMNTIIVKGTKSN